MAKRHTLLIAIRLLVGFLSLPLLYFGALAVFLLLNPMPGQGPLVAFILLATEELLFAAAIFGALCLIWAVAMPAWIERAFLWALHHLYAAMALGAAAVLVLFVGLAVVGGG